ncbi:type II toxin-antitoxin system VapC family toxin [Bradyrhizobium sp.]|uniref:type II toxin-antitoxin system VapC family toxin n=1 Tax=Bradyrhizobium sp. TaxID=376 RepID=UPI0025BDB314|nr:type II toxin-antitoxin system VapC family toxin [Bradyrhizobium sp.]
MLTLLLDTHTAIWLVANQRLAREAEEAINTVHETNGTLLVSPITAWEVGLLASHQRVELLVTPQRWFARLLAIPNVRLAELSPETLIDSSFLPGRPPRDPADRILLATARDLGATLVTRDRLILKYGEDGQVSTIAC